MFNNLRDFLKSLAERGLLKEIHEELDPKLEIPEIHRRVIESGGPALLFSRVKGASFPLVTNLFGSEERVHLAFGSRPKEVVKDAVKLLDHMPPSLKSLWENRSLLASGLKIGTRKTRRAPVMESGPLAPFLDKLPVLTSWPEDGGPFFTLPLVLSKSPVSGKTNLGMYRMQVYDSSNTGIHWQIHKGCGFHYHEAESRNEALPVAVFNGGPPALMLSAIAPLPEDVPELLLASLLQGSKLSLGKDNAFSLPIIAEAEFAFLGKVAPKIRRPEGPFGDHYGYYSLQHDYPVFNIERSYHRKDAIFCATVVGEPRQEDFFIGDYLQDLFAPLTRMVMPSVKRLEAFGETGFHSLAAAEIKVRYPKEAFATAMRILGEGQLSLTKVLMLTDSPVPFRPFNHFLSHILATTDFNTDIHIFSNVSQDTLDYTGPKVNEGSKMIWQSTGAPRFELELREPEFLPPSITQARIFCGGCVVVEAKNSHEQAPHLAKDLADISSLHPYRLINVVDSLKECLKNEMSFLWTVFTRFEPAADIYARSCSFERFHPRLQAPLIIDARMKAWYPNKLIATPDTIRTIDEKWGRIF